ncbi:hypothetical protein AQ860_30180 [Burkholderia pseudomallei]|nr:hypothetical protein AQ859_30885 [Burkholderia pseudomallei]OMZ38792.1 hypothetical protein AQ860_30180 [Burkholderia pseudomallei]
MAIALKGTSFNRVRRDQDRFYISADLLCLLPCRNLGEQPVDLIPLGLQALLPLALLGFLARLPRLLDALLMTVHIHLIKELTPLAVLPLAGQDDCDADLHQPGFQFSVFVVTPEQPFLRFTMLPVGNLDLDGHRLASRVINRPFPGPQGRQCFHLQPDMLASDMDTELACFSPPY